MKLIKKNPEHPSNLNTMLQHFFNDDFLNWPTRTHQDRWNTMPPANIAETEDAFTVALAVPGMRKEDFKIALDKNVLTIASEQNEEKKEEHQKFSHVEFSHASFTRTFHLPENKIEEEEIKASYEDGVLTIALPKKPEAKEKAPRQIEIA